MTNKVNECSSRCGVFFFYKCEMFYSLKADEADFRANTRIIHFRERKLEDLFTIVTVIKYFGR